LVVARRFNGGKASSWNKPDAPFFAFLNYKTLGFWTFDPYRRSKVESFSKVERLIEIISTGVRKQLRPMEDGITIRDRRSESRPGEC
jgi:hypothetical protein